jgi:hypothetical protein
MFAEATREVNTNEPQLHLWRIGLTFFQPAKTSSMSDRGKYIPGSYPRLRRIALTTQS